MLSLLLCALITVFDEVKADSSKAEVVISRVLVNRSNIFDPSAQAERDAGSQQQALALLAGSVNRFHKTTLESVILREAGISAGDTITVAEVAGIERRLRNLGIFASVAARLATGEGGVDLIINTRDSFSIVAGASGSYLGGVGNIGFTTGDKNLLGTGNELLFGISRTTTGNFRGSVRLTDLHFFEKPWKSEYSIGRTNEGDFFSFKLTDPFRSQHDARAWSFTTDHKERFVKYYRAGSTVVQVPEERSTLAGSHVWRTGTSDRYFRKGLVASFTQSDYSTANGVLADEITVPEDRRTLFIGGLLARDLVQSYRKVQGVDTLNYVQDLRLGSSAEVQLGVNVVEDYNSVDANSRNDPVLFLNLDKSASFGEHSLFRISFGGSAGIEESGQRPWSSTLNVKAYNTRFKNTTLALNADYTTGEDGSGLPTQLTLGENNGLRGYDARQFEGRHRFRLNLESRYRPGWKLGVLDVGLLGFVDAGWVADENESSLNVRRSLGAGLRLASNSLLGPRVIRVDFAAPLDSPDGESSDPSLSVAVGQVFRF